LMILKFMTMTIRMTTPLMDKAQIDHNLEHRTTPRMDMRSRGSIVDVPKIIINTADIQNNAITTRMNTICGNCTLFGIWDLIPVMHWRWSYGRSVHRMKYGCCLKVVVSRWKHSGPGGVIASLITKPDLLYSSALAKEIAILHVQ
jgi:hypothetical protein